MATDSSSPFTLRAAAGLSADPPDLAAASLLIIDAQVEYTAGALALPDAQAAVARIAALASEFRRLDRPVVHVAHVGKKGGAFDPEAGGRIISAVEPLPGETVIHKSLPNSFAGTSLEDHLESIGKPPLVLVGFMTHMCVSSTARAALDLGFSTTVVSDATATRDLPATVADTEPIAADVVHGAALAAMADRFSIVTDTDSLLTRPYL